MHIFFQLSSDAVNCYTRGIPELRWTRSGFTEHVTLKTFKKEKIYTGPERKANAGESLCKGREGHEFTQGLR